ncbi:sensor histidine kinase [Streptomyces parvus]|uniref:sensor histidine kinase n=1 Tax=Streptomyces parvus TaxID=66428 RepID=UPI001EF22DFC|nr:ATP-binding protein [Streptomyces parvus]
MVAAQQIAHFDRIALGVVEPGIGIAGRAVHDVAHILAELLDNATRFSPPDRQVGVTVWRLRDRAVVQIVDEGIGMSAQRRQFHNAALREPTSGIADVRCMGLAVVARLAERHGITVELRDSSDLGTIAEVGLPASVLAPAPVRASTSWTGGRHRDVGARQEEAVPRTSPCRKTARSCRSGREGRSLPGKNRSRPRPDRRSGGGRTGLASRPRRAGPAGRPGQPLWTADAPFPPPATGSGERRRTASGRSRPQGRAPATGLPTGLRRPDRVRPGDQPEHRSPRPPRHRR